MDQGCSSLSEALNLFQQEEKMTLLLGKQTPRAAFVFGLDPDNSATIFTSNSVLVPPPHRPQQQPQVPHLSFLNLVLFEFSYKSLHKSIFSCEY